MAEFPKLVITGKGQALLAKMLEGSGTVEFTRISTSSFTYADNQLEGLDSLSSVEQTSLVSKITRTNEVAVKVEAAFTNTGLTRGYYIKALGLYATGPDGGEILYAVAREMSGGCYMPAYNGVTVSGAYVQLVTTVGNAENVSLEVDAAGVATVGDIQELQRRIDDLEAGASGNVPENLWLVDDSTTARPLSVVTENFSTYPASDVTQAYVADAHAVGSLIDEDRSRISELEKSTNNSNLALVTLPEGGDISLGSEDGDVIFVRRAVEISGVVSTLSSSNRQHITCVAHIKNVTNLGILDLTVTAYKDNDGNPRLNYVLPSLYFNGKLYSSSQITDLLTITKL